MALGRPVVSTTIGCEGVEVINGQHLLIADEAEKFAEKTVRLLTDKALYHRVVAEARQLGVVNYDWDIIAERLLDIYRKIAQESTMQMEYIVPEFGNGEETIAHNE
jgi:glycosyltransferase involved in cell wall biosynthesis